MGAEQFVVTAKGKNAQEAFSAARDKALHDYGHAGYTGTIAEKPEFTKIDRTVESAEEAEELAYKLMEDGDSRVDDKWGPAGCLYVGRGLDGLKTYVFFGWASS